MSTKPSVPLVSEKAPKAREVTFAIPNQHKKNLIAYNPVEPAYVATGTGFLLGLWRPGQILSSDVPKKLRDRVSLNAQDYVSLIVVIMASLVARLWDISNPPDVVHEELMIGRRINNYMTGRFFYDSQPPLVGLIYTFFAICFRYPGTFDFNQFDTYIGHAFPYMELRVVTALMGVGLVIFTFLTLKLSGMTRRGATVGAIFVAFECSYAQQQRFIFQEPLVLLALGATVYFWKLLELQPPLGFMWHIVASSLSISLGCLVSSKNEGWWTVIWVFIASAYQLWWGFGDRRQKYPILRFIYGSSLRVFYFYLIPLAISALAIAVHIQLLPGTGEGTPFVSGSFQASLINYPNTEVVSPVGMGSMVSIRHLKTNVYLHSHDAFFTGGSGQQHVTGYGHRDLNNIWMVENITAPESNIHQQPFSAIANGGLIRLRHFQSLRRLHTHHHRAPITDNDYQFEVTAYGADGFPGDLNDIWQVEIVATESFPDIAKDEWRAIYSIVKFKHPLRMCYLFSHRVKLPESAFGQQEITCARNGVDENAYWFVETNYHPMHPKDADKVKYRAATVMEKVDEYSDLIESTHKVLQKEKASQYSRPGYTLPLMYHGIALYRQHHRQVLLVGNVVVWYGSIIGIATYLAFKAFTLVSLQRGWQTFNNFHGIREMDHHVGGFLLLWGCHFFPYIFKEHTQLPEYLPALYCSILASSRWWEYLSALTLRKAIRVNLFYGLLIAGTISTFIFYSPFVYGSQLLKSQCHQLELRGLWDLSCDTYLDTDLEYAEYDRSHSPVLYQYKAPRPEELVTTTLVTTAEKANPTDFVLRLDSPIVFDANKPDIKRFIKKYEKLGASKLKFADIVNEDEPGDVVPINAPTTTQDPEEEDEDDGTLDTEVEAKLLIQWARVTSPPSVTVKPELAKSAKDQLAEKSLAEEEEKKRLAAEEAEKQITGLAADEPDSIKTQDAPQEILTIDIKS